jgi:hypothetical protein
LERKKVIWSDKGKKESGLKDKGKEESGLKDKGKEESGLKDTDRNYKEFYITELMEVRLKYDPVIRQAIKREFMVITMVLMKMGCFAMSIDD